MPCALVVALPTIRQSSNKMEFCRVFDSIDF